MHDYPELSLAREDMRQQSELYRSSSFRDEASAYLVKELLEGGADQLRSLPKALDFFIPTYGSPGICFSRKQVQGLLGWFSSEYAEAKRQVLALDQSLSGHVAALSDYRVLLAADNPNRLPPLHTLLGKCSRQTSGTFQLL